MVSEACEFRGRFEDTDSQKQTYDRDTKNTCVESCSSILILWQASLYKHTTFHEWRNAELFKRNLQTPVRKLKNVAKIFKVNIVIARFGWINLSTDFA